MSMERGDVHALIRGLFEEEALLIGGLVASHPVEDEFLWRLMRNLDALRLRVIEAVDAAERPLRLPRHDGDRPHPAVEEFLARLRRDEAPAKAVRR